MFNRIDTTSVIAAYTISENDLVAVANDLKHDAVS